MECEVEGLLVLGGSSTSSVGSVSEWATTRSPGSRPETTSAKCVQPDFRRGSGFAIVDLLAGTPDRTDVYGDQCC